MSVFLRVREGTSTRDLAVLQPGQLVTIGRGDSNDVAFPGDLQMSFRHCTLRLGSDKCLLSDLNSTNGTIVDGKPVASMELSHGGRFTCGDTEFVLDWSSRPLPERHSRQTTEQPVATHRAAVVSKQTITAGLGDSSAPAGRKPSAVTTAVTVGPDMDQIAGFCSETALNIVRRFKLNQKISITPEDDESPRAFVDRLLPVRDGVDALCFLSFALPRRCAVWWVAECVRSFCQLDEQDSALLKQIEQWLRFPTDENRRSALRMVQEHELDGIASWVAQAAFCCHGSTTPPNCPVVPPKDDMAGKTVFATVSLASVEGNPPDIPDRRRQFFDLALLIADGEHPWPTESS